MKCTNDYLIKIWDLLNGSRAYTYVIIHIHPWCVRIYYILFCVSYYSKVQETKSHILILFIIILDRFSYLYQWSNGRTYQITNHVTTCMGIEMKIIIQNELIISNEWTIYMYVCVRVRVCVCVCLRAKFTLFTLLHDDGPHP